MHVGSCQSGGRRHLSFPRPDLGLCPTSLLFLISRRCCSGSHLFFGEGNCLFFPPLLGIKMQEIKAETPVRPVLPAALGAPARWVLLRQQLERISATRCTPWARWVSLVRLPCLWVREAVKDQTRRFRAEHAITKEPLCGCSHKANIVSIYGVAGQSQVFEHPPTTCRAPDATLYISTMLGLS